MILRPQFGDFKINIFRVVTVVSLGVAIVSNATLSEVYCARHPQSLSCEDPRSPLPQLPDEIPAATQASTAKVITTAISSAPVA